MYKALNLLVVVLVVVLSVFIVSKIDEMLRQITWYDNNIPNFWWFTEVRDKMDTDQQNFKDSLPKLQRVPWIIPTVYLAAVLLKLAVPKMGIN
jgi:hypothetical protein